MPNAFRNLALSQSLSSLGDILYTLSLVTLLYRETGSATAAALFPLFRVAGLALGGSIAPLGMARGRTRLSRILTLCLTAQSAGLALLVCYVGSASELPAVAGLVAFVLALSVLEGIAGPVRSTLLPAIVPAEGLTKANALLSVALETCSLAAWGLGAALGLWIGNDRLLLVGLALQAVAIVPSLRIREPKRDVVPKQAGSRRGALYGWKLFVRKPTLRAVLWIDGCEGVFGAVFAGAFLLAYAQQQLHVGDEWWGWINGAYMAGIIVSGLIASRVFRFGRDGAARRLFLGTIVFAGLTLAFAYATAPWLAMAVVVLMGLAYSFKELAVRIVLQTSAPQEELPYVFSTHATLVSVLFGLSLLLCGWISDTFGIRTLYVCAGIAYVVAAFGAVGLKEKHGTDDGSMQME